MLLLEGVVCTHVPYVHSPYSLSAPKQGCYAYFITKTPLSKLIDKSYVGKTNVSSSSVHRLLDLSAVAETMLCFIHGIVFEKQNQPKSSKSLPKGDIVFNLRDSDISIFRYFYYGFPNAKILNY